MHQIQANASAVSASADSFNIENFVREATWKDILIELVKRNELNPWDIDIIDIVEKYVSAVKSMKVMDLRLPANVILAAAMLVRLKSDMLDLEERKEELLAEEESIRQPVTVDPLSVRLRLPPKRRVSLNELIGALEEAMKLKELKEAVAAEEHRTVPMVFTHADVEADVESVFAMVEQNLDKEKMLTFSLLCDVAKIDDVLLGLFIPLLFLASKSRIFLIQEDFFGEIVIAINN